MGNMTGQKAVTYKKSQLDLPPDGQHDWGKGSHLQGVPTEARI